LARRLREGKIQVKGQRVVVVCTGHGMKDPDIIARSMPKPRLIAARLQDLEALILGEEP
jgi:threonine synthase